MSALTPITGKLLKLIPRLATEHDGEVVATVRAIGKALESAGLDWHALASAIEAPPEVRVVFVCEPDIDERASEPETPREMARWCRDHEQGELSPKERKFVADMCRLLGAGRTSSDRQLEWLRAIYQRLYCGGDR